MRILDVWLEASPEPIGSLIGDDYGQLTFLYRTGWLDNALNHPLSLSLPLREEPFGDGPSRAYFSNLLQENDQLDRTMAKLGIERGDVAGLLEHVGTDCAGAVSVLPQGHPPIKRPGDLSEDYDAIADQDFVRILGDLSAHGTLPDGLRDPSPLAGYRRKLSLAVLPGERLHFGLPKAGSGAPTTHILKVPDPRHPHEERDEAFVTQLAAECGLPVGTCLAGNEGGIAFLLIQRFDRVVDGTNVFRLHQEDFAQAAGLPPDLKYQRRGRPERRFDAATVGRILSATDRPIEARQRFLMITLFNLLIGNTDNHAKNHALLHRPGSAPGLAPFYDLVPVQTVPGYVETLAFNVGNADTFAGIGKTDLLEFCAAIGIAAAGAEAVLYSASRAMVERLEHLSTSFPREHGALDRLLGETLAEINGMLALRLDLRARDAHVTRGGGWQMS